MKRPEPAPKSEELKISAVELNILIKSTIMALQHANQTGNYSVLRDLGTPVFRERLDQARLTATFANLRSRGINLAPVLVLTPNLAKQPELTAQNELHLIGNFPTEPLQVKFEFWFVRIDGVWRIQGIMVDAAPPQPTPGVAHTTGKIVAPAAHKAPAANAKVGKKAP
ncbi:MAG TPA: hypothetical protein VGF29_15195 [Hyphomicrobiaceae bacterium]